MAETLSPAAPQAAQARVRRNRTLGLSIAAAIFVADQLSKWVVLYVLQLRQRGLIELLPIFDLRYVENRGVSMGLLTAGSETARWLLVALTVGIAAFVTAWLWREKNRGDAIALSFVLGGALGNILDRVRFGYVVDFADLHFGDVHPFLVFNVGDAAITIGVLLLLVRALLTRERTSPPEEE
jgi:signal peptidase II